MGRNFYDMAHFCPTLGFINNWRQLIGDPMLCPECKVDVGKEIQMKMVKSEGIIPSKERR